MNGNERTQRKRQVVQDFMGTDTRVAFALDETVRALQSQKIDVEVKIPSRVEGRFRTATTAQYRLGEVATYGSFPELISGERQRILSLQPRNPWTIEDIPASVQNECRLWAQQSIAAVTPGLKEAARELLRVPVDRMAATQLCPHCRYGEPRYACRSSGWTREVYRYPLMRLRDDATDEIFEVPFDAALYVDEHAPAQIVTTAQTVDASGRLTATLELGVMSSGVSAAYVARATDGRIQPQSSMLSAEPDDRYLHNMRRALDRWQEPGAQQRSHMPAFTKLLTGKPSCRQIIEELQEAAVGAYTERFTDIDYNQLLQSVRRNLGAKGLILAFGWHYQGQGESEASYQILTPEYERVGGWADGDPYDGLVGLAEKVDTPQVMTPRRNISGAW